MAFLNWPLRSGHTDLLCALLQILNAAYHVEVTFHSGSSVTRMLWEQIKQVGVLRGSVLRPLAGPLAS